MSTLSTAEVLRHIAGNFENGRYISQGLEGRSAERCEWVDMQGRGVLVCLESGWQFRLAPKTITYTVTHPEPLRTAPEVGVDIFWVNLAAEARRDYWNGCDWQLAALERGNLFATKEDAQAADAARLAAYRSAT